MYCNGDQESEQTLCEEQTLLLILYAYLNFLWSHSQNLHIHCFDVALFRCRM
jgi:hypothetical protein